MPKEGFGASHSFALMCFGGKPLDLYFWNSFLDFRPTAMQQTAHNPFFSIIVPAYNREKFIHHTLESLQSQSFEDWECVVVDDGSKDKTGKVVKALAEKDPRIRYVYQDNAERSAARNHGARKANGSFLCFLDSDDRYLQDHLKNVHQEIQDQGQLVALYFTGYCEDRNGKLSQMEVAPLSQPHTEYFLDHAVIPARTCLHRKIFETHQFDEDIVTVEDQLLWIRIADKFSVVQLPQTSVAYAVHDNNSINLKNNPGRLRLQGVQTFAKRYPQLWQQLPKAKRRSILIQSRFTIAKYHLMKGNKGPALGYLCRCILTEPGHPQFRHWLLLLAQTLLGQKNQYQQA